MIPMEHGLPTSSTFKGPKQVHSLKLRDHDIGFEGWQRSPPLQEPRAGQKCSAWLGKDHFSLSSCWSKSSHFFSQPGFFSTRLRRVCFDGKFVGLWRWAFFHHKTMLKQTVARPLEAARELRIYGPSRGSAPAAVLGRSSLTWRSHGVPAVWCHVGAPCWSWVGCGTRRGCCLWFFHGFVSRLEKRGWDENWFDTYVVAD